MKLLTRIFLCTLVLALYACGEDDGDDGGGGNVDIGVSAIQITDVENGGNAADILIEFNVSVDETSVDHYRVIVVKATVANNFDLATAEATPAASYSRIDKTGSAISTNLSAQALDSDGDAVSEGTSYNVFVLSVGTTGVDAVLARATNTIRLAKTDILEIVAELPIGTGGVVVDENGNIFCADFGASLSSSPGRFLYKVTPVGTTSIFASGFQGASGNTIGPDGNIYQSNIAAGKVSKVTPNGQVSDFVTGMSSPVGLVFDNAGNLYVANCGDNSIRKVTPNGSVSVFASGATAGFACPNGITIDDAGNLYVANFSNANISKITPTGSVSTLVQLPSGNNGHITFFQGNLYVVDRGGNRIYKVTLGGSATVLVGSGRRGHKEGPALQAELSLPNDLGFSPDGKYLYINDSKPLTGTPANSLISPTVLKRVRLEKD